LKLVEQVTSASDGVDLFASSPARLALSTYLRRRLAGPGGVLAMLARMLCRSFGAGSFAEFWRYWNPLCAYYLSRYCYRPLRRRRVPRPLAIVATFAASGLLIHDLPFWWSIHVLGVGIAPVPIFSVWFVAMAGFVIGGERLRLDYSARPPAARVALNVAQIAAGCVAGLTVAALAISR
jgi:hypothetical protein